MRAFFLLSSMVWNSVRPLKIQHSSVLHLPSPNATVLRSSVPTQYSTLSLRSTSSYDILINMYCRNIELKQPLILPEILPHIILQLYHKHKESSTTLYTVNQVWAYEVKYLSNSPLICNFKFLLTPSFNIIPGIVLRKMFSCFTSHFSPKEGSKPRSRKSCMKASCWGTQLPALEAASYDRDMLYCHQHNSLFHWCRQHYLYVKNTIY